MSLLIIVSNSFQVNIDLAFLPPLKNSPHLAAHTLSISPATKFAHHEAMVCDFFFLEKILT